MLCCSQNIVITFMATLDFIPAQLSGSSSCGPMASQLLPYRQLTSRSSPAGLPKSFSCSCTARKYWISCNPIKFDVRFSLHSALFVVRHLTWIQWDLPVKYIHVLTHTLTHTRAHSHTLTCLFHTSALRKYLHACGIHLRIDCMQQIVRKFAAVSVLLVYGLRQRWLR